MGAIPGRWTVFWTGFPGTAVGAGPEVLVFGAMDVRQAYIFLGIKLTRRAFSKGIYNDVWC